MMKLGIITSPNPEGIRYVASLGLKYAEFDINVGVDVDGIIATENAIKNEMAAGGVNVGAIGRWGPDRITADGIIASELETEKKLIDFASFLGCPVYITGCNYLADLSFYENCTLAIEYVGKLIEYAKLKNIKVCTYNCNWNSFLNCDPAWTMVHGYLKDLGIKFDPSHTLAGGRNILEEMEKWGDRFYHIHLKGSLYVGDKHIDDPPAGLDGTDWGSFMAMLYYKHYDGMLSIEPHSQTWFGEIARQGVEYTIDYFKKLVF